VQCKAPKHQCQSDNAKEEILSAQDLFLNLTRLLAKETKTGALNMIHSLSPL